MDIATLEQLLQQAKSAPLANGWIERGNHSGNLICVSPLLDAVGVTIPGITLEMEVKANSTVLSCFYLFTLMQLKQKQRARVFQLEVVPDWKRSHIGLTVIHGPHEHVLDLEPSPIVHAGVNCGSWSACAHWFFARTAIAPLNLKDPFHI